MPKISEAQQQARRDQIARAAVEQFAARGIHSTSIANIVEASGLSAGALYTHFAGKDEIIAHVARATVTGLEALLETDPLPAPDELIAHVVEGLAQAEVPTGFIVQVWSEAITNPAVHSAANDAYADAFQFLREYAFMWLSTGGGLDVRQARALAPRQARVLVGLIYAHILQASLLDGYSTADFLSDIQESRITQL